MPHTCEDCGETFDTLTRLRLHDCPEKEEDDPEQESLEEEMAEIRNLENQERKRAKRRAPDDLPTGLERAQGGDRQALYTALGQYERYLSDEWNNYEQGEYWGGHHAFFEPAVEAVETALHSEGWPFLLDLLDAYWPESRFDPENYPGHEPFGGDETDDYGDFPHVSHVLVTVTGKQLIRTRRGEGVEAVPADALEYLLLFHRHPGDESPWIDSMSYGWGIGHPDHAVAETVETLVEGEYEIWAGTATEHAMHADQYAATALIENVFEDGIVSDPVLFFRPLGSIERGEYPDGTTDWNWETLYPEFEETGFDWDDGVRERLRAVIEDCGFARQLPEEWTFADIVL